MLSVVGCSVAIEAKSSLGCKLALLEVESPLHDNADSFLVCLWKPANKVVLCHWGASQIHGALVVVVPAESILNTCLEMAFFDDLNSISIPVDEDSCEAGDQLLKPLFDEIRFEEDVGLARLHIS